MALTSAMPSSGEIALEGTGSLEGIGERTDDYGATNVSLKDLIVNVRGTWDTNPNIDTTLANPPFRMGESYAAQYGSGGGGGP